MSYSVIEGLVRSFHELI